MKKIFCILSILTIISPAFAEGEVAGEPVSVSPAGDGTLATANGQTAKPGYQLKTAGANDATSAASALYVKGAYNATIKAVNTVASIKQDKLTSSNVTTSGSGAFVTGVSASAGAVNVATGEVSIPTSSYSASSGRAAIWLE